MMRSMISRSLRRNKSAVSTAFGYIVAVMIVFASVGMIIVWGVPYVEERKRNFELKNSFSECNKLASAIDSVVLNGIGTTGNIIFNNPNEQGSFLVKDETDRMIIYYSYNYSILNFSVSGLYDEDERHFTVTTERQTLDNITVYWLNDTCFVSGTRVLMADGSYKCIEDVRVGDWVRSYDERLGCVVSCRVSNVFHHSAESMGGFYLVLNDGLGVTPNHRFFSGGDWVPVGSLGLGDCLFTSGLDCGYSIFSKSFVFDCVPVFDLSVEGCHNFFVNVESGVDVLVHNVAPPDQPIAPGPENITLHTPTPGENYTGYPYNITIDNIHTNTTINPTSGDTNFTQLRFNWSFYANRIYLSDWINFSGPPDSYPYALNTHVDSNGRNLTNISMPWPTWFVDSGHYELTVQVKVINSSGYNLSNWSGAFSCDVDPGVYIPRDAVHVFTTIFDKPPDVIVNSTGAETEICTFEINIPHEKPELTGAVRIDLYNSTFSPETGSGPGNFTRNGTFPVGRIWIFDMGVINYNLPYYDGTYKIVMENGGTVVLSPDGESRFLDNLGFYETSDSISMRVISIKRFENESYLARGAGECIFRFKNAHSYGREFGDKIVYNFSIKMFGSNADVWLEYMERRFKFVRIDENTLKYDCVDGKKLLVVSSVLKANVERILK